jgi:hypothetical protein
MIERIIVNYIYILWLIRLAKYFKIKNVQIKFCLKLSN